MIIISAIRANRQRNREQHALETCRLFVAHAWDVDPSEVSDQDCYNAIAGLGRTLAQTGITMEQAAIGLRWLVETSDEQR